MIFLDSMHIPIYKVISLSFLDKIHNSLIYWEMAKLIYI